jgi:hypothetical protein
MSAAGPSQGGLLLGRSRSDVGGKRISAAGPPQGAGPPVGGGRAAASGGNV